MTWIINASAVLFVSITLTGVIIPQILHISHGRQLYDKANWRKVHRGDVPRLGGLTFVPVIVFALCLTLGLDELFNITGNSADVVTSAIMQPGATVGTTLTFGLCGLMLIYVIGMLDDLSGLTYKVKLIAQLGTAILLVTGNVHINNLNGLFGLTELPDPMAWMLSCLLIMLIINSINLIDGIDGLASGLSGIALLIYGCVFIDTECYLYALIAFATLGTLLSFFVYNVFGNAAKGRKIFMGDTGSLTIGTVLAFLAIQAANMPVSGNSLLATDQSTAMVLAFSPLAIPCLDVVRVFLHRVKNGSCPFLPDRTHIHHKLQALGLTQHATLATLLTASVLLIVINLAMMNIGSIGNIITVLIFDIIAWAVTNTMLTRAIKVREHRGVSSRLNMSN
jgi:UDP-N-acetylmuramyl pentapeptide phosphotransferase/UDP-N-acetylglucosamine-1-phosphate transferase